MKWAVAAGALLLLAACHPTPRPPSPSKTPAANGVVLPDGAKTPGVVNTAVTQANIAQTICVPGWTASVRPPVVYTSDLKARQLAAGYTYQGDTNPRDYEEDHLIPLELGGSPDDPRNLWPEPYFVQQGARVKDRIENRLHDLVCAGQVTLGSARDAVASNWWAAYQRWMK